jgi:FkbM family methyltransferase
MREILRIIKKIIKYIRLYNLPENKEIRRISKIKRHSLFSTNILGIELIGGDSASFIGQFNEIIKKEIYSFNTQADIPYIVDCGANIGMSLIYFKRKFPGAEIVAFEPDPNVFSLLSENINKFDFDNITLFNKGVWNEDGKVIFSGKGDDAGRIIETNFANQDAFDIEVVRLRPFLHKKVHLLKIDIEGAEFEVIQDISDLLNNVEKIFIEYHSKINEEQNLHKILEILHNNGFRYFIEQTTLYNLNPFINITVSDKLDNLLNIYGYRNND